MNRRRRTDPCGFPDRTTARPADSSSSVPATTAARCSKWLRPTSAVKHKSPSDAPGEPASHASYRPASSRNVQADFADNASTCAGRSPIAESAGAAAAYPSTTTCALVPLKPKLLTPAIRRPGGHGSTRPNHRHRKLRPRNPRARLLEMHLPRQFACVQRQHNLDQTRDPGRRLQMTNVRLHRTKQQRPVQIHAPPPTLPPPPQPQSDRQATSPSHAPPNTQLPRARLPPAPAPQQSPAAARDRWERSARRMRRLG